MTTKFMLEFFKLAPHLNNRETAIATMELGDWLYKYSERFNFDNASVFDAVAIAADIIEDASNFDAPS